jgi:hypothetical protein
MSEQTAKQEFFQNCSSLFAAVLTNIENDMCTAVWVQRLEVHAEQTCLFDARSALTDETRMELIKRCTGAASASDVEGYESLREALELAYKQATVGNGYERYACSKRFADQSVQRLIDLYGLDDAFEQADKKMQEAQRLPKDRAVAELAGAIVYIAGAIAHIQNS